MDDYAAVTRYAEERAASLEEAGRGEVPVVWMGHSLGASIATCLLPASSARCDGLVFENGFASIPRMVAALYPSKWVPYHYLGRWAFDTWDARGVFQRARGSDEAHTGLESATTAATRVNEVPILFLSSSNDELVPPAMMRDLYSTALHARGASEEEESGVRWVSVKDGLHDFGWRKEVWATSVVKFVRDIVGV